MQCKDTQKTLSAYFEGVISSAEKKGIEDHLKVCPSCRKALEDLKKAGDLVRRLDEIEPPPWLTEKIMARIREEEEQKGGFIRKLFYPLHIKVPIQAMATVFIAVMAVYLFQSMEPEMHKGQIPSVAERASSSKDEDRSVAPSPAAPSLPPAEKAPPPVRIAEADRKMKEARVEETLEAKKGQEPTPLAKEGKPIPSAPSFSQEKQERLPAKHGAPKAAAKAQQEPIAPQAQFGHAPVRQKEEVAGAPRAAAPAARELKSAADAPPVGTMTYKRVEPIGFSLRVQDLKKATMEVERFLTQVGAQNIKKEDLEGKSILTATVKVEKIDPLHKSLTLAGEVEKKAPPSPAPEEDAQVRIEIIALR